MSRCKTCGAVVEVVGKTTNSYEPLAERVAAAAEELVGECSASGHDPNFCRYCETFLPHHADSCQWAKLGDAVIAWREAADEHPARLHAQPGTGEGGDSERRK